MVPRAEMIAFGVWTWKLGGRPDEVLLTIERKIPAIRLILVELAALPGPVICRSIIRTLVEPASSMVPSTCSTVARECGEDKCLVEAGTPDDLSA